MSFWSEGLGQIGILSVAAFGLAKRCPQGNGSGSLCTALPTGCLTCLENLDFPNGHETYSLPPPKLLDPGVALHVRTPIYPQIHGLTGQLKEARQAALQQGGACRDLPTPREGLLGIWWTRGVAFSASQQGSTTQQIATQHRTGQRQHNARQRTQEDTHTNSSSLALVERHKQF